MRPIISENLTIKIVNITERIKDGESTYLDAVENTKAVLPSSEM
jgi:hypothetical protein